MELRITLLLSVIVFLLSYLSSPNEPYSPEFPGTINAVIGDVSFVEKFNREPNEFDSESTRIITHLEYVVSKLETAEVYILSDEQLLNRKEIIGHLKKYIANQEFPKNYDYEDTRLPTFIDKDGNICAVGYLVAQTAGLEVAEALNEEFKYDYIYSMDSPVLKDWLIENGLSKKEAAMIQPSYVYYDRIENDIEPAYLIASGLLTGAQIGITGYSFASKTPIEKQQKLSLLNAGLGVTSLTLGLLNLDNERPFTGGFGNSGDLQILNQSRENLSIANIAFGSASAIFNGLRYFSLKKRSSHKTLQVTTAQLHIPETNTLAPALNVNWRF